MTYVVLSKIFWFFAAPSSLIVLMAVAGVVLLALTRRRRGFALVAASAIALGLLWLLPIGGWPSLFIAAGVLPILVATSLAFVLPESLTFLGTGGVEQGRMRKIALRIAPSLPADTEFYTSEQKLPGVPLKHLFTEGRALGTILLWILFFLDYGILIFFLSWVPTLIKMATGSTTALGMSLAFWNRVSSTLRRPSYP